MFPFATKVGGLYTALKMEDFDFSETCAIWRLRVRVRVAQSSRGSAPAGANLAGAFSYMEQTREGSSPHSAWRHTTATIWPCRDHRRQQAGDDHHHDPNAALEDAPLGRGLLCRPPGLRSVLCQAGAATPALPAGLGATPNRVTTRRPSRTPSDQPVVVSPGGTLSDGVQPPGPQMAASRRLLPSPSRSPGSKGIALPGLQSFRAVR
jgi:hypothetical protein